MFFLAKDCVIACGRKDMNGDNSEMKFQILSVSDDCNFYLFINISILNLSLIYLKCSSVHKTHNCGHKSNYSVPFSSQEFASSECFWNKIRRRHTFNKERLLKWKNVTKTDYFLNIEIEDIWVKCKIPKHITAIWFQS